MELPSLVINPDGPHLRPEDGMPGVPVHSIPGSPEEMFARDIPHSNGGTIFDGISTTVRSYGNSLVASLRGLAESPIDAYNEARYLISHPRTILHELLCGLTMSIIIAPQSISFAYIVDFPPMAGMYATFFMGFFCAVLGVRPAMLSSCAGSMCAILSALGSSNGVLKGAPLRERQDAVLMSIFFIGIFQMLISWLRLAQYAKLLPQSAMIGFVNGLAIVILQSQFPAFQRCSPPPGESYAFNECPSEYVSYMTFADAELLWVLLILVISTLVILFFPKVPVLGRYIPSTLVALILGAAIEYAIVRPAGFRTRTLGDTSPLDAVWPTWRFPSVSGGSRWGNVLYYAGLTSLVGLIESLMTVQSMSEILGTKVLDSDLNRESFAQAVGNMMCGLFGGIGGCGTIGESNLNLRIGSRHRMSAMVSSWTVLLIVVLLSPIVNLVPMASLAAAIFSVMIHTFYWPTLWTLHRMRKHDAIIVVVVMLVSLFTNLAIAMGVGFIIAAINNVLDGYFSFSVAAVDIAIPEGTSEHAFYYHFHPRLALHINSAADEALPTDLMSPMVPAPTRMLLPRDVTSSRYVASSRVPGDELHDDDGTGIASPRLGPSGVGTGAGVCHDDHEGAPCDVADDAAVAGVLPEGVPATAPLPGALNVVRVYRPQGLLFFGSARLLKNNFAPAEDPLHVVFDFSDTHICDLSASMALMYVVGKYVEAGRCVKLVGLNGKSRRQAMRNTELRGMLARVGQGEYRCRSSKEYKQRRAERDPWNVVRRFFGMAHSNNDDNNTAVDAAVSSETSVSDPASPVPADASVDVDAGAAVGGAMTRTQSNHSSSTVIAPTVEGQASGVGMEGEPGLTEADDVVMDMGPEATAAHLRQRKPDTKSGTSGNTAQGKHLYNLDMLNPEQ